jgi:hypothetical protein
MSFPNPDNYARDCDCGTAGANTTPPPASLVAAFIPNPLILPNGGSINTLNSGGVGGSINLSGLGNENYASNGGSIDLRALAEEGSNGGSIILTGSDGGNGGSITSTGASGSGGGSINLSGGNLGAGGSINLSNGGGSIDLQGDGSIQFGVIASRTTLVGGGEAEDITVTLPNYSGSLPIALISTTTTLEFSNITAGNFLDLTITLSGAVTSDVVFVTCVTTNGRGATDGKLIFEAFVSAANTVTVRAHNPTSGTIIPNEYNFRVAIIRV